MVERLKDPLATLFESDDTQLKKDLDDLKEDYEFSLRCGDDEGAKKMIVEAIKLKMGVEVIEGEGNPSGLIPLHSKPKLEVIDGGLEKVVPLIRPTST